MAAKSLNGSERENGRILPRCATSNANLLNKINQFYRVILGVVDYQRGVLDGELPLINVECAAICANSQKATEPLLWRDLENEPTGSIWNLVTACLRLLTSFGRCDITQSVCHASLHLTH